MSKQPSSKPHSTASSTTSSSTAALRQQHVQPSSSSRRRSTPLRASPQVKSSYGAPADSVDFSPSHTHPASGRQYMHRETSGGPDDTSNSEHREGESAAVREARLKAQKLNATSGRARLNGSVHGTSVNVATAFHQAELARSSAASPSAYPAPPSLASHNAFMASSIRKETHQTVSTSSSARRGPLPPAPMTQIQLASSRSPDDDPVLEEERNRRRRERTKSPVLDAIAGAARALSPVSYLLKPRVAQGGPFPDEEHDQDGAGYQSFSSFRTAPDHQRRTTGDSSFLSASSAADISGSSHLALGADRSHESQASDYAFDEEQRLMNEMEAKRARAQSDGVELREAAEGRGNGDWFSALAGFVRRTPEPSEPNETTPRRKPAGVDEYDPEEDDQGSDDLSSSSYEESDRSEDTEKPTKTTRRRRRISDDAKPYRPRAGESADETDSSDAPKRRKRKNIRGPTGAFGMVPVVEGKKRRSKGGRKSGAQDARDGGEAEDEVVVSGERRRTPPLAEEDADGGGLSYEPQPTLREDDSFIVRFYPGADNSPNDSHASASHQSTSRRFNLFQSICHGVLVFVVSVVNQLVRLLSWLAQSPHKALDVLRRTLHIFDSRKVAAPLAATAAALLLAFALARQSIDPSTLEDTPSSWRSRLSSIGSRTRSPYSASPLPPDLVDDLLERLGKIEYNLQSVSASGQRAAKDFSSLSAKLGGIEKRLDDSDRAMASLDSRAGSVQDEIASLQERVREAERVARLALEASKVAQAAADGIEAHLPSRLAVRVNPQTKALEIEPSFWRAMRDVFVSQSQLPGSVASEVAKHGSLSQASSPGSSNAVVAPPASWEAFLASNEKALDVWSDEQLSRHTQAGAIVSRFDFLQVLRSEVEAAKVEIEERAREETRRNGDEVGRRSLANSAAYVDKVVKQALAKVSSSTPAPQAPVEIDAGDDVTSLLSSMIDTALLKFSKDTIAKADYALWTAGGRVIPHITSDTYTQRFQRWGGFASPTVITGRPPSTALDSDIDVGQCWPFAGSNGQLGIKLARRVRVTDITVEHAAREVSFDMAAAPRDVEIWGFVEGQENLDKVAEYHAARAEEKQTSSLPSSPGYILLGQLAYDISTPKHIQTVSVPQDVQELGVDVGIIVVRINSNYGANYTCLYRVRVHGETVPELSAQD